MDKNILVSIVTPCYNSEGTIARTIESVLGQTYQNIEYWIIDGGSTDRTVEIVKGYHDERIHLISEPDTGIYNAMNKGLKHASGELIGIINSDDWYEADAVEAMVESFQPGNYEIHYGMLNWYREAVCYMTAIIYHDDLNENMIPHPTCFVDAKVYEKFGLYDESFRICADRDFMMRCVREEQVHFVPHKKVIANFSAGGMSTESANWRLQELEVLRIKNRYGLISDKEYEKRRKRSIWIGRVKQILHI